MTAPSEKAMKTIEDILASAEEHDIDLEGFSRKDLLKKIQMDGFNWPTERTIESLEKAQVLAPHKTKGGHNRYSHRDLGVCRWALILYRYGMTAEKIKNCLDAISQLYDLRERAKNDSAKTMEQLQKVNPDLFQKIVLRASNLRSSLEGILKGYDFQMKAEEPVIRSIKEGDLSFLTPLSEGRGVL